MRISNVVIGFFLAIVLAYIHDVSVSPLSAAGRPQTLVNWDVFGQAVSDVGTWLRQEVDKLIDQIHWRS